MKFIARFLGVVLCLCLLAGNSWSATAGKVTGRVTDAGGKPLPGVNVSIQGTRSGAVSDADGYYLILSVDPGVYEMRVSIIGYETVRQRNVEVFADRTTTKNFALKETAVAGAEVVVQAERPLVEVDRTSSEAKISLKEIAQVPILRSVNQHLQYVAGVDPVATEANGVRLRRHHGYSSDTGWQTWTLDGMELTNLDTEFQSPRQYNSIPVTSIGEIGVVKGGANASQPSSPAGVINIVTREGTRSVQGGLDFRAELPGKRHRGPNVYDATPGQPGGTNGIWRDRLKWNDPVWGDETDPVTGKKVHVKQDYEGAVGYFTEGWLAGPLGENATFVVSGKVSQAKQTFPAPVRMGLPQWNIFGKLTFTPTPNLKLKLAYNQSNEPRWGAATGGSDLRGPNTNLFLVRGFTGYEQQWRTRIAYLTVTHILSPRTFYEFQVGFYGTNIDTTAATDPTTDSFRRDKSGYFNLDRNNRTNLQVDYNRRYNFRYDLSSQVSRRNLVKVGFTHQSFNNTGWIYQQGSPSASSIYVTAEDSQPGKRYLAQRLAAYAEDKLEFQGFVMNAGLRYDVLWGGPTKTLGSWYKMMPGYRTYNAYLTRTPRARTMPMVSWAPRLGVSHPVTAKSAIRFDFGKYYKPLVFGAIWTEGWNQTDAKNHPTLDRTWADEPWAPGGGWRIDSGFHSPGGITNTTEFEVAGDWNFVSDFVLDMTTYYRRTEHASGGAVRTWGDPVRGDNWGVSAQVPAARFEAKGFEVSLYKPLSHTFSFRASVDVGWSFYRHADGDPQDVRVYPDSNFIASSYYFLVDKADNPRSLTVNEIQELGHKAQETLRKLLAQKIDVTTEDEVLTPTRPLREYPNLKGKDRDRPEIQNLWYRLRLAAWSDILLNPPPTTQASFQFLWSTPSDWGPGPKIGGSKLFGGIQANLVWRFDSGNGINYTPPNTKIEYIRPGPLYVRTDLNFQKTFETRRVNPTIYAEVFNLFNSYVDRSAGASYIRWGLQRPTPNNTDYQKYGDPSPFRGGDNGGPRYVNAGVRFGF